MKQADYNRLEAILSRAYTLAAQVMPGDEPDPSLAEEVSGECAELLALMDGDMAAFDGPEFIDPELLALARALQPQGPSVHMMSCSTTKTGFEEHCNCKDWQGE